MDALETLTSHFSISAGNRSPKLDNLIETPVFHAHGDVDHLISMDRAKMTSKVLKERVKTYEFHSFPGMGHSSCEEEMNLVKNFILKHLPPI